MTRRFVNRCGQRGKSTQVGRRLPGAWGMLPREGLAVVLLLLLSFFFQPVAFSFFSFFKKLF